MIKVIFLKKVAGIQEVGQIKSVSNGYALNYLIPHGLAELATKEKVASLEQTKERAIEKDRQEEEIHKQWIQTINGKTIELQAHASAAGRLYAAIPLSQVVAELNSKFNLKVTDDLLSLPKPIKTAGEHTVTVGFEPNLQASFILKIIPKTNG
ncbi:MAG: 50S ribosomal protein L9 [Patescibacteria group bacterium]